MIDDDDQAYLKMLRLSTQELNIKMLISLVASPMITDRLADGPSIVRCNIISHPIKAGGDQWLKERPSRSLPFSTLPGFGCCCCIKWMRLPG